MGQEHVRVSAVVVVVVVVVFATFRKGSYSSQTFGGKWTLVVGGTDE